MEKTIRELESDFARLTAELQAQQQQTIPAKKAVNDLKTKIATQRADNEHLVTENAKLESEIDKHKALIESNRDFVEMFEIEMSRVREQAKAKVFELRLTNSEKQAKIAQLENARNPHSIAILVDAWKALSDAKAPPMPAPMQPNSAASSPVKIYNPMDPNQYG